MSVMDIFLGASCGVSVYETDRENWVTCAQNRAKLYAVLTVSLTIVVCCILVYFGASKLWLVAGVLVCASAIAWIFVSGKYAALEYDVFDKKLASHMANGATRENAINEIRRTDLEDKKISAMNASANKAAGANLAGFMSVANAIRSR